MVSLGGVRRKGFELSVSKCSLTFSVHSSGDTDMPGMTRVIKELTHSWRQASKLARPTLSNNRKEEGSEASRWVQSPFSATSSGYDLGKI